MTNEVNSGS